MTDTWTLEGIVAKNYDLYLVAGNYSEEELNNRIKSKLAKGIFAYEERVKKTHLSKEYTSNWLLENMSNNSEYVFMHEHKERS